MVTAVVILFLVLLAYLTWKLANDREFRQEMLRSENENIVQYRDLKLSGMLFFVIYALLILAVLYLSAANWNLPPLHQPEGEITETDITLKPNFNPGTIFTFTESRPVSLRVVAESGAAIKDSLSFPALDSGESVGNELIQQIASPDLLAALGLYYSGYDPGQDNESQKVRRNTQAACRYLMAALEKSEAGAFPNRVANNIAIKLFHLGNENQSECEPERVIEGIRRLRNEGATKYKELGDVYLRYAHQVETKDRYFSLAVASYLEYLNRIESVNIPLLDSVRITIIEDIRELAEAIRWPADASTMPDRIKKMADSGTFGDLHSTNLVSDIKSVRF